LYSVYLNIGQIYYKNNNFNVNLIDNYNLLDGFVSIINPIKIKLFYNKNQLFIFNDFINIEINYILIYDNVIYNIIYIKDNQIFCNKDINLSDDNKFYEFILCIYPSIELPNSICYIDNSFKINSTMHQYNLYLNNEFPLEIIVTYNDSYSVKTNIDLNLLNIHYNHPVYLNGVYNYIINCSENLIYFSEQIYHNDQIILILSPLQFSKYFLNNIEIYYNNKINQIDDSNIYIEYQLNNNLVESINILNNIDNYNYNYIYFNKYKQYNIDYNLDIGSYHLIAFCQFLTSSDHF
jgi:hypothetical protein